MILQHDGFDHYGTTALQTATSVAAIQWVSDGYVQATGTCACNTSYGKNSGSLGVGLTTSTSDLVWIKKPIKPEHIIATNGAYVPTSRLVLGAAIRFPLALTGMLNFMRMGGVNISIGTDWFIYVDGVVTTYQCELNIWNFVELRFDIDGGKFQLYMTDTLVLEKAVTNPTFDFWEIRAQLTTGSGSTIQVNADDYYLLDGKATDRAGVATANVERMGKCTTLTRYPTADSTVQMTPDTGTTNFSRVNSATPDGDSSYVSGNVAGVTDLYTNLTAFTTVDDAAIRAVTIVPSARLLEPDSLGVTAVVQVDDKEYVGFRMKLKAATYSAQKHIFEASPKTAVQWTPTEALNVKFGHRILAKAT